MNKLQITIISLLFLFVGGTYCKYPSDRLAIQNLKDKQALDEKYTNLYSTNMHDPLSKLIAFPPVFVDFMQSSLMLEVLEQSDGVVKEELITNVKELSQRESSIHHAMPFERQLALSAHAIDHHRRMWIISNHRIDVFAGNVKPRVHSTTPFGYVTLDQHYGEIVLNAVYNYIEKGAEEAVNAGFCFSDDDVLSALKNYQERQKNVLNIHFDSNATRRALFETYGKDVCIEALRKVLLFQKWLAFKNDETAQCGQRSSFEKHSQLRYRPCIYSQRSLLSSADLIEGIYNVE